MINICLIVDKKNSNGCSVGQLWLADILGACDQTVFKGTDGTGSKLFALKFFAGRGVPSLCPHSHCSGSLPALRKSHFS